MRLTNHDLNRNTSAAVAIRKALKEKEGELSGGVDKSHETRWQAGKDRPEASEQSQPNAQLSGSKVSRTQSCGDSVPHAQLPPCNLDYAFKDIQRRFGIK